METEDENKIEQPEIYFIEDYRELREEDKAFAEYGRGIDVFGIKEIISKVKGSMRITH